MLTLLRHGNGVSRNTTVFDFFNNSKKHLRKLILKICTWEKVKISHRFRFPVTKRSFAYLALTCKLIKRIMSKAPLGTKARTGENCPESGVWKVVGTPSTTAPISKGNRMPPYSGNAVTWELISYA